MSVPPTSLSALAEEHLQQMALAFETTPLRLGWAARKLNFG